MPKIDVYRFKRPASVDHTRTFENGMVLTLRKLGIIETQKKEDLIDQCIAKWITGVPVHSPDGSLVFGEDGKPVMEIAPFPSVQVENGEPESVEVNERVIRIAATIEAMQVQPVEDRYDTEELLVLAATNAPVFAEIMAWTYDVGAGTDLGKKLPVDGTGEVSTPS